MSPITTHVLDLAGGRPAAGIRVVLHRMEPTGEWTRLGTGATDDDGRVTNLLDESATLAVGVHRLTFATAEHYESQSIRPFHPHVEVLFTVSDVTQHYHVPLLLSPFGYTTYRGS